MVTLYDVRPVDFGEELKEELKDVEEIEQPDWSHFVKTSSAKERPPEQEDWWYSRAAAILRKIYINGPLGVNSLRREFSDAKEKGSQPEYRQLASGKIIRSLLQQLEDADLLEMKEGRGRKITSEGRSFLDNIAHKTKKG